MVRSEVALEVGEAGRQEPPLQLPRLVADPPDLQGEELETGRLFETEAEADAAAASR